MVHIEVSHINSFIHNSKFCTGVVICHSSYHPPTNIALRGGRCLSFDCVSPFDCVFYLCILKICGGLLSRSVVITTNTVWELEWSSLLPHTLKESWLLIESWLCATSQFVATLISFCVPARQSQLYSVQVREWAYIFLCTHNELLDDWSNWSLVCE